MEQLEIPLMNLDYIKANKWRIAMWMWTAVLFDCHVNNNTNKNITIEMLSSVYIFGAVYEFSKSTFIIQNGNGFVCLLDIWHVHSFVLHIFNKIMCSGF